MPNNINQLVKDAIVSNNPISFGKIGGIEASHIMNYLVTGEPKLVRGNSLAINAGIVVKNENELRVWHELFLQSVKQLDYVLEWCPEQGDKYILDKVWNGKKRFYSFEGLEPFEYKQDGWHCSLSGKKVLELSPLKNSIEQQIKKYDKLWESASIKELSVIKTPQPPALTGEEEKSFLYTLKDLQEKISRESFDVAIVGCGGFSLLLLSFIKNNMKKPSIHLGGATQLLFGIRGKRWDVGFKDRSWYGTKEWIRPLEEDTPINKNLVEEGCYW